MTPIRETWRNQQTRDMLEAGWDRLLAECQKLDSGPWLGMYSDAPPLFWEFLSIGVSEFSFSLLEQEPLSSGPRYFFFDSAAGVTATYENRTIKGKSMSDNKTEQRKVLCLAVDASGSPKDVEKRLKVIARELLSHHPNGLEVGDNGIDSTEGGDDFDYHVVSYDMISLCSLYQDDKETET